MYRISILAVLFVAIAVALLVPVTQTAFAQEIQAESTTLLSRAAPGDVLPLAVKLVNFGNSARVDVTIFYEIKSVQGDVLVETSETVAVETTASFVKQITLPKSTAPGNYIAQTRIVYADQLVPATASYQFEVERAYFGVFLSDLIFYSVLVLFGLVLLVLLLFFLLRKRARDRLAPRDYSHVPREQRVYYEIIGDAILQMRYHEGNDAVDLALNIPGLVFDDRSGRVVSVTGDPAAILAELVQRYKEHFGKDVSFSASGQREGRAIVR